MITKLTKKNWKMDKNDSINRVRKYLLFAFDYYSTFQRDFNAMLYFLQHKSTRRNRNSISITSRSWFVND